MVSLRAHMRIQESHWRPRGEIRYQTYLLHKSGEANQPQMTVSVHERELIYGTANVSLPVHLQYLHRYDMTYGFVL